MSNATDIAEFMQASGHPCRTVPTANIPDWERVLRAKLVYSEAVEFVTAMGCNVTDILDGNGPQVFDAGMPVDLVEAADACADLRYVVVGSENTLGVPGEDVFREVHRSNMTKLVNGEILLDEDRKVMKPPSYEPPDVAGVLRAAGWITAEGLMST